MEPTQRYAAIQALGNYFALMPESEIDKILTAARAPLVIPSSWRTSPEHQKLATLTNILRDVPDSILTELMKFLPGAGQMSLARGPVPNSPPTVGARRAADGPIFVVHGHDRAVLHEAVRVLERATAREVIVLHEQANAGRTILEKFENHAALTSFAVVLLTGDDEGGIRRSASMRVRSRQNVIFELGFFFGKLGRRRVAVLLEGDIEKPSDLNGLVYIELDSTGAWKYTLARELEAADISVDRSRIP